MRKPIYDPKKRAIPCKFGGYRRLCDMTPAQLAEEGYDEMGERLLKVEPLEEVKKLSDADFNKPRQLHNCDSCSQKRDDYVWCSDMVHGRGGESVRLWRLKNLRPYYGFYNGMIDGADNCPGWKERE